MSDKYGYWPKTEQELIDFLHEHENKSHSYESVAESLTEVTLAMFNYFASKQGMTGFQASWGGLQFLKKSRGIEGPFGIIDGSKLLYPQYDLRKQLEDWIKEWEPQLAQMAKEKLEETNCQAHPDVLERWQRLASLPQ
ncbi:hypothetical protein [Brevibacillus centrosporus]|uniref:hypothetical protein n=1 Tax=Brevibacillus centrosporus TaxID=54910 RepID=UPI003B017C40